ncbi:MAG: hypothetical protein ACRCX2_14960 [Paraclostridium sp.]
MRKRIPDSIKNQIRALYITGKYITLTELGERFGVTEAYIYKVKSAEKWDTFKMATQENLLDVLGEKIGCVMDSIEYYESVQAYCKKQLNDNGKKGKFKDVFYKGEIHQVPFVLSPQEMKVLTETFLMCDERILLLRTIKLQGEDDE